MIGRCYDKNHSAYKSYGAKGVYVEEYLLNFKNYCDFLKTLPNYNKLKKNPKAWQVDKDLKSGKCYSKDTLTIMKNEDNLELENCTKRVKINQYTTNNKYIQTFESINQAEKITHIHRGNIARCVRGQSHTAGGFKWKKVN